MMMSVPKLSRRVGDWILKELSRGESAPIIRAGHVQRPYSQYLKPLFGWQTEANLFQGALFQKHHHFSTITADTASEVESEENKKVSAPKVLGRNLDMRIGITRSSVNVPLLALQSTYDLWISVTFVDKEGEEKQIMVPLGMSMLEAALENDMELEGACEGSLACSTCHVIVMDMEYYNKLEDPTDEENDMLDLAFGLSKTSRLGCQVIAKPELDGIRLAIPTGT
ncbi:adrenodoxin-like protein 2, mitochondrial [Carya illinoinensis]|uniref:adrenodoxin-like protein 2, mitochondrial n=1 Tax=Carya illinoinensis TaxID=32201 RepID=UPI001C727C1A|nr:adrenodoxin-like protein 2, mitochondrial [Carya illinoinensis]